MAANEREEQEQEKARGVAADLRSGADKNK
jgi:hypothetical protein